MQKISIHIKKYIPYVLGVALLVSCEQDAIEGPEPAAPLPALSAGSLEFKQICFSWELVDCRLYRRRAF